METRQMIIQSVMQVLKSKVDQEILDIVQDALTIELNRYEVQERTTELSVVDNSAVGMLRRYIATKKIEGKAESTLKRYWEQNLQLIQFLGKDLNKITTDDLRLFMACRRQQNKVSNRTLDGMRRCYRSFFTSGNVFLNTSKDGHQILGAFPLYGNIRITAVGYYNGAYYAFCNDFDGGSCANRAVTIGVLYVD